MADRIIGEVDFVDGSRRLVYEGPDGRQYVLDDEGELVHGVWVMPAEEVVPDLLINGPDF
jgi:hypothetical protein